MRLLEVGTKSGEGWVFSRSYLDLLTSSQQPQSLL